MFHLCDTCQGKIAVEEHLRTMISSHEFVDDDTITYRQWLQRDQHHYISKAQSSFLCDLKDNISSEEDVVLGFAENYSLSVQDAVL